MKIPVGLTMSSVFIFDVVDLVVTTHATAHTAFQSGSQVYPFTRMPFEVTNRTACFQRKMDEFPNKHELQDTYGHVDNLLILSLQWKSIILTFSFAKELPNWTNRHTMKRNASLFPDN